MDRFLLVCVLMCQEWTDERGGALTTTGMYYAQSFDGDDEYSSVATLITAQQARRLPPHYRPLIGMLASPSTLAESQWPVVSTDADCIDAVLTAGGEVRLVPIRLPCRDEDALEMILHTVLQFDGLLFTGSSSDVDPRLYGQTPQPQTAKPESLLDWWVMLLALVAQETLTPLFGVCGEAQRLNVAFGGTLHQDMPGHRANRIVADNWMVNTLELDPEKLALCTRGGNLSLSECYPLPVNVRAEIFCMHHQGLDTLAPAFLKWGWSGSVTEGFGYPGPQTLTIDPAAVRAAMTDKTAAIVPVHLPGQMAAMLPLLDLADRYCLYVVEDASQAHGATYSNDDHPADCMWYAGSLGDLGCFSMNGVKNMGALADAGMAAVSARQFARNRGIVERLRGLRDLGRVSMACYVHDNWGWRARMDEFAAAECLLELAELDNWHARRRQIAARYDAALAGLLVQAPVVAPGRQHVYFNYAVQSPSVEVREQLEASLKRAGIEVADTYTLVSDQKVYRTGQLPCRVEALDVARQAAGLITHLPLYPELEEEKVERVIAVLRQFALA